MSGNTSIIERSHYPDDLIARALSLSAAGYSSRKVERLLAEEYGADNVPTSPTIWNWSKALSDSLHEQAGDRERMIIARCDDLIAEGLGYLEGKPGEIAKSLMSLNALRGTMADKQLRRDGVGNVQVGPFILAIMPNEEPGNEPLTLDTEAARIE